MPLNDNDVHMILLVISAITLVLVSLVLLVVLHKGEGYSNYGNISEQPDSFKDKTLTKNNNPGTSTIQDPSREQIYLTLTLHPDFTLRRQIEDNYGQLERLRIQMENDLFNLHPHKEYHISQIQVKPPVDGQKFIVYGKLYPRHTYGLFHFRRTDNKTQALVPLTSPPDFGFGAEELIYSDVSDLIKNPNSPIKQVL